MKNLTALLLLLLLSFGVTASEDIELQEASIDLSNNASLQRGAKHFVTYCLGCHSIKHIRYLRIALDTDVDQKKMLKDIAPEGASIYDQLHSAMNKHDAEKWFGTQPPDLSLIARSRGADWLYSYLKSYYTDPKSPRGVNNLVFQDTAMPNPLWQLQGEQHAEHKKNIWGDEYTNLVLKEPGTLSAGEFDIFVNDLVNFLVYVGEPVQLERQRIGKYVIFYILMFLVVAYLLKKEYWKKIH
ncbi:MAG: cytochrome c1 [Methylobacter tundripaludum]|uniref:Ubiquinol-cytochrome c reductase cytochrome c1 subunit n=1 Tax=Methylobacter tundripaludum TaxID=173365 RepID=A0A2S6GNY9_9GAMM|nr:cytochrome c1 [Methylobacter tundripaludum]MCK9637322.1 cytochrome c1 [Methylobacter tundripaludum]PPK66939.1 ubiquinol-cytochrome c reductase cytochrome c1 subunit [Methylobacter tundripaludum]